MYNVGDKVVIVKTENKIETHLWSPKGMMDVWCGKIMTIRETFMLGKLKSYRMNEDVNEQIGNGWVWYESMIDHEATAKLWEDKMKTYNLIEVMNSEEGTKFKIDDNDIYFVKDEKLYVTCNKTGITVFCNCSTKKANAQFTLVQSKITLTDDEKCILRNVDSEYKWIARDKDETIWLYTGKPERKTRVFYYVAKMEFAFEKLFTQITFENSPHLIEDLLK